MRPVGSRNPALPSKQLFEQIWLQAKVKFHVLLQKTWFLFDPQRLLESSKDREHSGYRFSGSGRTHCLHIHVFRRVPRGIPRVAMSEAGQWPMTVADISPRFVRACVYLTLMLMTSPLDPPLGRHPPKYKASPTGLQSEGAPPSYLATVPKAAWNLLPAL